MGTTVQRVNALEDGTSMMRVFTVCKTLTDSGIAPTRELIAEQTGFRLTTVDEALKQLRKLGFISREPASYKPLTQFPDPRVTSGSILDDGYIKLEVGDDMMLLTPEEARRAGMILQGYALEATALLPTRALEARQDRLERSHTQQMREIRQIADGMQKILGKMQQHQLPF